MDTANNLDQFEGDISLIKRSKRLKRPEQGAVSKEGVDRRKKPRSVGETRNLLLQKGSESDNGSTVVGGAKRSG